MLVVCARREGRAEALWVDLRHYSGGTDERIRPGGRARPAIRGAESSLVEVLELTRKS